MAMQPSQRATMRGQFKTQSRPTAKQRRRIARIIDSMEDSASRQSWARWTALQHSMSWR